MFDFSKMEEDAESLAGVLAAQQHVLSTDFVASEDSVVSPDGGGGVTLEGDAAGEVDVERNMEQESVVEEDSLPKTCWKSNGCTRTRIMNLTIGSYGIQMKHTSGISMCCEV